MPKKVNLFIDAKKSIKDCINKLNITGLKTLIVVGKENKLLGTISDGDVRKSIIKNQDIERSIKNIYQKKPFFLKEEPKNIEELKQLFIKFQFDIIPLINNKQRLIKIYSRNSVFDNQFGKNIKIPLFILAGGEGNRMRPFTNVLPKPLLPINGQPIIENIIEKFMNYGVEKFLISVNYKKEILKAFFDQTSLKKKIIYIRENQPLGTAGSLYYTKEKVKNNLFVTNCDVLFMINYMSLYEFHTSNNYDMTIVVSKKNFQIPYGTCEVNSKNQFKKIIEKPKINLLANTGLYILNKKILKLIKYPKYLDMTDLITLSKKNKMRIGLFPISEDCWIDVGQWDQYKKNIDLT